ncbi:MAG: acylphosphatase [Lentisphaerota bacterium]
MKVEYEAYLVKIIGRVTGVGFRYSTRDFVNQFSETRGYVRNVRENEVEVLIQGKKEHLEVILAWLTHGPSHARVDDIKINKTPLSDELGYFKIK